MTEELRVPAATLASIQERLGSGRAALEETGGRTPGPVDGGELTGVLTGLVARVLDGAAALSEALAAVQAQVAEAGSGFRETDAEVAASYRPAEVSGAD